MDSSKLDTYINLLTYGDVNLVIGTEPQTLIRQLDKEILFFNNLEDSSIYKTQELSKLRAYMTASSTALDPQEYMHIKGYDWLILNHERYRDCFKEHYSVVFSACSYLNTVVSHASELFDEATASYCLNESLPLSIALLPVNLLCTALTAAFQLQTLPSNVIYGMQCMSDVILGCETEGKSAFVPFCSAKSVAVLRRELSDYHASLYKLLKGPVLRQYRLLQSVRLCGEDSVLWYRCETPIQSPRELSAERWLDLGERERRDCVEAVGCVLAVAGACLAEDAEHADVLAMLADVGRVLLSDQCVLDAAAEVREVLAAVPKTRENKARLGVLLKEVKGYDGVAAHQQYREHCISLLQHWESNLKRDAGCLAPCLFVVAAVVRVSLEELKWAAANSLRVKRQLFAYHESYEMANGQDDSFPRLLRAFVRLRQLALAHQEVLPPFTASLRRSLQDQLASLPATPLESLESLESLLSGSADRYDWMRALFRVPGAAGLAHSLRLLAATSRVQSDALACVYGLFDIPHISLFYSRLFSFCETNYKKKGLDPSFIFLFIDVASGMLHSAQVLSPTLQATLADQILSLLQEVVAAVVAAVDAVWRHHIAEDSLPASELVDGDALEELNRLLGTYQRVELGPKTILPAQLLTDSAVNAFLRTMGEQLRGRSLPAKEVLRLITSFFAALEAVATWVSELPVARIMAACRDEWTTNSALGLAEYFRGQARLDKAAGLSLLHQAFFLGDVRCAFFGEESVASVVQLLGFPFVKDETDRLLERLAAAQRRAVARAQDCRQQGLFRADDCAGRAARFSAELDALTRELAEVGRADTLIACYNHGCALHLRQQEWEVEGVLREAKKEGLDDWRECATALCVVDGTDTSLDSRCEQAAALGTEGGLRAEEAAELGVLVLVNGLTVRKEVPTPSPSGVWSCHWNEFLHGLSFVLDDCSVEEVMRRMIRLLVRLEDERLFPLLQSSILYCQQVPSLQRAIAVVDALSPFLGGTRECVTSRGTESALPATTVEEESDYPCL